ncbi:antigen-presenting glycoprotein CD1d-like [Candoia aspera]|uniref:antigen-presenting glycoprotein CD1d-like n=1 Tax=Candoia aspera TaxID=51853 RepID=UPI002FD7CB0E
MEGTFKTYFACFQQTVGSISRDLNTSYPLVVQSLLFCETGASGLTRAFYDVAINGEAMVTYKADNSTWVALKKDKVAVYIQDYLNKDTAATLHSLLMLSCVQALQSFLQVGKATVDRQVLPDGVVFAQKSSIPDSLLLVCRVTNFHPRHITVSWLKDGKELSANSTGILPNYDITHQIRVLWLLIQRTLIIMLVKYNTAPGETKLLQSPGAKVQTKL